MSLLNKLHAVQAENGYLPKDQLIKLASEEGMSLAALIGTASFYGHFSFERTEPSEHTEKLYACRKTGVLLNPPGNYMWDALKSAMSAPEKVIPELKAAGLVGRGGGEFPVWAKWQTVRDADCDVKYVICNADEGEPGTGKDRVLIERNPKAVVEGMAICAETVRAKKGYIYLRGEYADLEEKLREAIEAMPAGRFEIEVFLGHGAYVCGEETALMNSVEGQRGESRLKPPYPGIAGLWGKPTIINNAETFANVPLIMKFGAENFRKWGTEDFPGTRLYTVCGDVKNPGVYELEAGADTHTLLKAAGGETEKLKAVLIGGGSGELIPAEHAAIVRGTGSARFVGESKNLVAVARELTEFYAKESCGMCMPCRVGLKRLAEMLYKHECGEAYPDDTDTMSELCSHIRANARCGLAKAAVTPTESLVKHFPEVLK